MKFSCYLCRHSTSAWWNTPNLLTWTWWLRRYSRITIWSNKTIRLILNDLNAIAIRNMTPQNEYMQADTVTKWEKWAHHVQEVDTENLLPGKAVLMIAICSRPVLYKTQTVNIERRGHVVEVCVAHWSACRSVDFQWYISLKEWFFRLQVWC